MKTKLLFFLSLFSLSVFGAAIDNGQASVYKFATVADMVAATMPTSFNTRIVAIVADRTTLGDKDGGTFWYDPTSVATTNLGTIFPSVTAGCWLRQFEGAVSVGWFGAKLDYTTDDTTAIQNALDSYNDVYVPAATTGFVHHGLVFNDNQTFTVYRKLKVFLKDNSNTWMIRNADQTFGNQYITITGGIWNGNSANQTPTVTWKQHGFQFRGCDNLIVQSLTITNVAKFALRVMDSDDVLLQNLKFNTLSDAIHINGPAARPIIKDVWATTGDDTVCLCAADWANYNETEGDIVDAKISNINLNSAFTGVRYLGSGTTKRVIRPILDKMTGTLSSTPIRVVNDQTVGMMVEDPVFSNIYVQSSGNTAMGYFACLIDNLTFNNVGWTNATGYPMLVFGNHTNGTVTISNAELSAGNFTGLDVYSSVITNLVFSKINSRMTGNGHFVQQEATADIKTTTFSDSFFKGGTDVYYSEPGGTKSTVLMNNVVVQSIPALVNIGTDFEGAFDNIHASSITTGVIQLQDVAKTGRFRMGNFIDGGSITARISKGASYTLTATSMSPDFYMNAADLSTPGVGEFWFDSGGLIHLTGISYLRIGASLEKITANSANIAYNREVSNGSILNSQYGAFQIHHEPSTDGYLDRLNFEVYATNGATVTTNAMYITRTNGVVTIGGTGLPTTIGSIGQVLTVASTTNATWQTPSGGGGGTVGTVINTGTPTSGTIPQYSGTTGTNVIPSSISITSLTSLLAGTGTLLTLSGTSIDLSLGARWVKSAASGETYTFANTPSAGTYKTISFRLLNSSGAADITPAFTGANITVYAIQNAKYAEFTFRCDGDGIINGAQVNQP